MHSESCRLQQQPQPTFNSKFQVFCHFEISSGRLEDEIHILAPILLLIPIWIHEVVLATIGESSMEFSIKAQKPKSQPKVCQIVQVLPTTPPYKLNFLCFHVCYDDTWIYMSWCWTYALFKCANDLVKMKLIIVKVIMDSNCVTYLLEQRKGMLISINTIYMYMLHCLISSKQCLPQLGVIKRIAH
jgi:hypothetical protein